MSINFSNKVCLLVPTAQCIYDTGNHMGLCVQGSSDLCMFSSVKWMQILLSHFLERPFDMYFIRYFGMNILVICWGMFVDEVACASIRYKDEQLNMVVEMFINANEETLTHSKIEKLHATHKLPVIVGGTNYYIESLLWQMLSDRSPVSIICL